MVLWYAAAILLVLLALGVVLDRVLEGTFVDQLTSSLVSDARAVQEVLPTSPTPSLESEVVGLGQAIGARITIIRTDGVVLADSEHDPVTMQNHRTRPEVQQALRGRIGEASRTSATLGIAFRYVALPPAAGRIVRVALPLTAVQARLRTVRVILAIGFGAAALAGILALAVIGRGVSGPLRRITTSVEALGDPSAGEPGLDPAVPEEGTAEIALLARTVNRMRADVAERVQALENERAAREAILSALSEGVVLFETDGSVAYQNARTGELLGRAVEAVRRLAPVTLQELVAEAATGAPSRSVEVRAGPGSRTLLASAVPVPADGRVLLVLRDVTQARRADAVRRDFVANASHELKTPAASIRALAETMASAAREDPDAVGRFAGQLEREAVRLSRIISDLLDLSRLEGAAGAGQQLRLDRLVANETERFRGEAAEAGLALEIRGNGALPVRGSAGDLSLLVGNLVRNAIQYTRPGGRIEVVTRPEAGPDGRPRRAVLVVSDTGIGIPAKDRDRIFERFYRVDRARSRETGGTGLGLAIVKHVVENHGGSVSVLSELGQGSTFRVELPLDAAGILTQ
jgi:two-component system, OmpR family, phosphate regulon sensor histidine kinase PhoR